MLIAASNVERERDSYGFESYSAKNDAKRGKSVKLKEILSRKNMIK